MFSVSVQLISKSPGMATEWLSAKAETWKNVNTEKVLDSHSLPLPTDMHPYVADVTVISN